jgi:superfamily II DNA/RNA helicase
VEDAWSARRLDLVVATVAFGLGIDRRDVRWVAHWTPPRRWDDLWQHAGRAGRDGQPATSLNWAMEMAHVDPVMRTYLSGGGCRRAVLRSALGRGWDHPWRHGVAVGVAPPARRPTLCCDRCDEVAELAA